MRRLFRRRRADRERIRQLAASVACLTAERDAAWRESAAQRAIIADLGRQLDAAHAGPLGDNPLTSTVPLPRVRSAAPVLPFPPKEWTT